LRRLLIETFEKWVMTGKKVNSDVLLSFKDKPDPNLVADTISGFLDLPLKEKLTFWPPRT
jgi:ATP-dependent Lon protease